VRFPLDPERLELDRFVRSLPLAALAGATPPRTTAALQITIVQLVRGCIALPGVGRWLDAGVDTLRSVLPAPCESVKFLA